MVVMAFDEAGNLEAVVQELRQSLSRLGVPAEILIVDDGSTDGTPGIADALGAAHEEIRVLHHGVNRGLGGVYRSGFAEARGRLLTFFPADGQFPAVILEDFVPRMAVSDVDILLGYVPRTDSWAGRALSALERLVWRCLLGPLPRFQGVFLVRCDRLRALELRSEGRGWGIVLEMLLRARNAGWRMESRPTPIRPRTVGTSKVQNLRTVWSNLRQVLALKAHL